MKPKGSLRRSIKIDKPLARLVKKIKRIYKLPISGLGEVISLQILQILKGTQENITALCQ